MKIYHSLIYPIVTQNMIKWVGCMWYSSNRTQIILNKILKNNLSVKFDNYKTFFSTNEMYKSLQLFEFSDTYKFFLLKFHIYFLCTNFHLFLDNFSSLLPNNTRNSINFRTEVKRRFIISRESC